MKYIRLSVAGLCIILIAQGCNPSKGHPGIGFFPKITEAVMVNVNTTGTFKFGDQVTFSVQAEDEDLNMKTLWVTVYTSADSENPFDGPYEIALPKQTSDTMTYSDLGPITLSEPVGNYTMNLQIEDARGNETSVFTISFNIE
jgi:hypothetical protein